MLGIPSTFFFLFFFFQNESASISQIVPSAQGGWICILLSCISLKRFPWMPSVCLDGLLPEHSPSAIRMHWIKSPSLQLKPTQSGEERTLTASLTPSLPKPNCSERLREYKQCVSSAHSNPLYLRSWTQTNLDPRHSVQRKFWQNEDVEPHMVGRAIAVEFVLGTLLFLLWTRETSDMCIHRYFYRIHFSSPQKGDRSPANITEE